MAVRHYANAPATKLAASCSATATSITVVSTSGLSIQYPYVLIIDRGEPTEEVVEVTAAANTVLTVTRGVDSTPTFAHSIDAVVVHGFSARDLREANQHIQATNGVHGLSGSVVGTSDTQVLTNKDLRDASNLLRDLMPVGAILPFAGATAPTGYLIANGQAVSRTTYAALFAICGTTYGTGNGTTTFNLPNIIDRFPYGTASRGIMGGASTHTLTLNEMPAHNHSGLTGSHGSTTYIGYPIAFYNDMNGITFGGAYTGGRVMVTDPSYSATGPHGHTIPSQGGGQAHNNMPPYVGVNYIIKA